MRFLKAKESGERMYSILVIEDDKTINDLLCRIITKSGYAADSAGNGLLTVTVTLGMDDGRNDSNV